MLAKDDQWSFRRGLIAVRNDDEVRFVQVWSQIGSIVISGDEIARRRVGLRAIRSR